MLKLPKLQKIIDKMCPNFCSCSKVNDKILFLYNAFNCGNLTNDIVNSNNDNSNSNNSNSNNGNSNNSYSNISNSIISNVSNSIENNVYVDSSVCEKVFNFLLGGRSINNSTREWKDLFKCQVLILILHSWWLLRLFFNRLYLLLLVSNGLCSIGSNRIILLLLRASMLKKQ